MLKSLIARKLPILLLTTLTGFLPLNSVNAGVFDETEVNQDEFIAIAQPFGENKYNLIVIEQIPEKDSCWNEMTETANPVNVDLLLKNFDFTGHCRRSTDANGYSIRYEGEDYGLNYLLTLVEKDGELLLMGTNRRDRSQPPIIIGSSKGLNGQAMKIKLNPGWRFTKRTYEGKILGHVYFSYDSASYPSMTEEINPEQTSEILPQEEKSQQNNIREIVAPQIQTEENVENINVNQNNMLPDDRVRKILAPDVQSNKQLKKSNKIAPITQNTGFQFINKTWELK